MRQVAVGVVGILIGLLHSVLKLEPVVVGSRRYSIVHPGQPVAFERTGQVVNQAVAAGSRLSVALKPQDVTVPVITRHLLRKPVGVRAYAAALTIGSGGQAVKAVVGKLVAAQGGLAARLPRQAADVAVVAGRAAAPSAIFNVFYRYKTETILETK